MSKFKEVYKVVSPKNVPEGKGATVRRLIGKKLI